MQSICKNISILYRYAQMFFNQELKHYGLGCGQLLVLLTICENPGCSQEQISEELGFDKGTVARTASHLEEAGYVRREIDGRNRRAYKLFASSKACASQKELEQSVIRWNDILCSGMSAPTRVAIRQTLTAMMENASEYLQENRE